MRSSTIDVYADDRGCAVGLDTDDDEKSRTYGWRVVRGSSGVTFSCYGLDSRDAHTDYKAAHDYSDTYDMAVSSEAAHTHTALVGESKYFFAHTKRHFRL
ncbi:MAG: hypothetical protein IKH15_12750 [Bacteroidales bacterium]|nr:hypothetical protein [Bacteroidales bacterium]MBR4240083.1 hypothetical protein [Prevotella sp.]